MLSKEALKNLNTEFWFGFKKRMQKHKSCSGKKTNWLNYKTNLSHIFVRMETDKGVIRFCFDFQLKDNEIREIVWEQMHELKTVLESEMGEEAVWHENYPSDHVHYLNRIFWQKEGLNYLNQEDTEEIYAYFEHKLLCFDRFYDTYQEILINLIK